MTDIHGEIRSLLAAYVMDAVPEDEVPAIRAHILSCEECFQEAESYAESLGALAASAEPVRLPAGFADRVVQAAVGQAAVGDAVAGQAAGTVGAGRETTPSVPWFRRSFVLSAAAVLGALVLVVATASLVTSIQREREYERIVAALVKDEGTFHLEGPGGAAAVISSSDGGTTLVALNLGEAPEGSDYQLWLMKDGVPTPSETFDGSGSIAIVESSDDLELYDGAAITVEPDGGSPQPTTEPVLSS